MTYIIIILLRKTEMSFNLKGQLIFSTDKDKKVLFHLLDNSR